MDCLVAFCVSRDSDGVTISLESMTSSPAINGSIRLQDKDFGALLLNKSSNATLAIQGQKHELCLMIEERDNVRLLAIRSLEGNLICYAVITPEIFSLIITGQSPKLQVHVNRRGRTLFFAAQQETA